MISKLHMQILKLDQFGYTVKLSKNGKDHKTFSGGIVTIILKTFLFWMFIKNCFKMLEYTDDSILQNETLTDYDSIGQINLISQGTIPFFRFMYKGEYIKNESKEQ